MVKRKKIEKKNESLETIVNVRLCDLLTNRHSISLSPLSPPFAFPSSPRQTSIYTHHPIYVTRRLEKKKNHRSGENEILFPLLPLLLLFLLSIWFTVTRIGRLWKSVAAPSIKEEEENFNHFPVKDFVLELSELPDVGSRGKEEGGGRRKAVFVDFWPRVIFQSLVVISHLMTRKFLGFDFRETNC